MIKVVTADNSSIEEKIWADYICDGKNDSEVIQKAIDDLEEENN